MAGIRSYRRGRCEGMVALPALLVDGLVTGMWARRTRGRRIDITVEPTEELTSPGSAAGWRQRSQG